jgi:4-amino-4-deoxy-L-arabinose transferase-like glycosyltransferase
VESAEPATAPTSGSVGTTRRFLAILALIIFAALGLRVAYVLTVTRYDTDLYDATYYELEARTLTHGPGFFVDPFPLLPGGDHRITPAADHPPLTVLALVPAALIEPLKSSKLAMHFTMVLFGTGSVVLIGLVARKLAGDTAGLVAAGIATLDPNLWMNDGLIMSEAIAVLLTVAIIYGVYRVLERGTTWGWTIGLGVLCGLMILTRAELGTYLPFLVLPALWIGTRDDRRMRPRALVAVCASAVIIVAPWIGYNLSRFEDPTFVSTNDGLALSASNCPATYYGDLLGSLEIWPPCTVPRGTLEESVYNADNRSQAVHYMIDHAGRLPVVLLARLGRTWSLFKLGQTADLASHEGRPVWATYLGAVTTWIVVPLAVFGAILLRRRRRPIWPLVMPIVLTAVSIAPLAGGLLRYRATAEPSLVILGTVGVLALLPARWRGDSDRQGRRAEQAVTEEASTASSV